LLITVCSIFEIARYCAVISSWVNWSLAVTHESRHGERYKTVRALVTGPLQSKKIKNRIDR